jgi:hypothetical protein
MVVGLICGIECKCIMKFEEYYLLGCDATESCRSLLMFSKNVLPSSSGLKSNPSNLQDRGRSFI